MTKREQYIEAKKRAHYVSKNGAGYGECSVMDMISREEALKKAKEEYALELGMKIIEEQDNEDRR